MNAFSDENIDGFTITFRQEILFYLRQLINDGDQISVAFNEGRDTILTILLDVDEEAGTLIFDWGSSEEVNKRFLVSEKNFFVATPQGIRNQFVTGKPKQITYKKRPAFSVALPKKYVRLQRRDYFRLKLPMTQRPPCLFNLADGPTIEASVLDIGLGGLGLEVASSNVPCNIGDMVSGAKIHLNAVGDLSVNFAIRYVGKLQRGAKTTTHIGCQFDHLSPAQEQQLQKFITVVQREERARLGK